jgi:hypothetical protein
MHKLTYLLVSGKSEMAGKAGLASRIEPVRG